MNSLLELENIFLEIPKCDAPILNRINYTVYAGDFIVILGSNGSGKSSLLKLIDGRYSATAGQIVLDGKLLRNYSSKKSSRAIKTLTQNCHDALFISMTVLENYLLVKQQYEPKLFSLQNKRERKFFQEYLAQFNVKLSDKMDQVVANLSGGEKQALALALIMLYPPRILLLDEHTSALDPSSAENLMRLTDKMIKQQHMTCLLTTHDLAIAEQYGNRIVALKNGRVHQQIEREEKIQANQALLLAACY